jgi:hypothetical protein
MSCIMLDIDDIPPLTAGWPFAAEPPPLFVAEGVAIADGAASPS